MLFIDESLDLSFFIFKEQFKASIEQFLYIHQKKTRGQRAPKMVKSTQSAE